jgi:hypothetical protein
MTQEEKELNNCFKDELAKAFGYPMTLRILQDLVSKVNKLNPTQEKSRKIHGALRSLQAALSFLRENKSDLLEVLCKKETESANLFKTRDGKKFVKNVPDINKIQDQDDILWRNDDGKRDDTDEELLNCKLFDRCRIWPVNIRVADEEQKGKEEQKGQEDQKSQNADLGCDWNLEVELETEWSDLLFLSSC